MSREPTAEQIEAVAHVLAERFDGVTLRDPSAPVDVARIHREIAGDVLAAMNAESLTPTPEPSTTETGRQPNQTDGIERMLALAMDKVPPGYEYEYRAVVSDRGEDIASSAWLGSEIRARVAVDHEREFRLERRLVGPPERIEE